MSGWVGQFVLFCTSSYNLRDSQDTVLFFLPDLKLLQQSLNKGGHAVCQKLPLQIHRLLKDKGTSLSLKH